VFHAETRYQCKCSAKKKINITFAARTDRKSINCSCHKVFNDDCLSCEGKITNKREMSGSHGDVHEDGRLLGCFTVQPERNWPTFQRCLLPPLSRPKLNYSNASCHSVPHTALRLLYEHTNTTIVRPVVLYGYETWSVALRGHNMD
jgi:hypothetical protein